MIVPNECMEFTEVFRTIRIEHSISLILGLLIGFFGAWNE